MNPLCKMRIDAHQHFWKYNPVRDAWIEETMRAIRKDFLPEDLQHVLLGNRMDGCVAVQADQSENETQFLLDLAGENSFIKGVVGWVDLKDPLVEKRLAFYSANPLFKGVRHIVQAEADDYMLDPAFQNGIRNLRPFGLTYDILVYPRQLPAAIRLVETFPGQLFVIDHIGKPEIAMKKMELWSKYMREIAGAENVFCKLSGMVTEADWSNWELSDFYPYMDFVFDAFGEDRIIFGSDWPVCNLAGSYRQVIEIVEEYCSQFGESTRAGVFGENAIKFYNLNVR